MKIRGLAAGKLTMMGVAALLAVGGVATANAFQFNVNGVTINTNGEVKAFGSGCPEGTASISTTDQTVSISYSAFQVQNSSKKKKASWAERSKVCTIDLPISVPDGFAITPAQVTFRGTSSGEDGRALDAIHGTRVWFAGQLQEDIPASVKIKPTGDFGDWSITHQFLAGTINPICDGFPARLRLQERVTVNDGAVAVDTADLALLKGLQISFNLHDCTGQGRTAPKPA